MGSPHDAAEPRGLIDAIDPTEELANDITSELPSPDPSINAAPRRAIDAEADAVKHQANGHPTNVIGGTVLHDRYVLERDLGYGGMAVISRARDLRHNGASDDGPHVAIKRLRPELRDRPQAIARLRREFHQTQLLAHPNVVRFYDFDCDRGSWFIAMELLDGEALGQRLRRASPLGLPVGEALQIAAACGDALAFAHDRGVTHGDVKPDNVFVTSMDGVRLLDFGAAPESMPRPPADSPMMDRILPAATRAYASPEVLAGQGPEPRDDVFSLACVIYEMLAGRHPYGRRGANEARDAHLEIEPIPDLSTRQWRALAASLAWRREQRPADVRELLRALGADAPARLPTLGLVALPGGAASGEPGRPAGRRLWLGAAAIAAATVVGMLIGRFGFESRSAPPRTPATAAVAGVAVARAETAMPRIAAPAADLPRPRPLSSSGRVSFDMESMLVSRRAVAAAIPVRRLDEAGRSAKVAWRAMDGTALAGRDYGGPSSGVARLGEGGTVGMIYVPILSVAQVAGARSFTVELTGVSPGASLGVKRRVIVTIQDDG